MMYHVILKNILSRSIKEAIVEAECTSDIVDFFRNDNDDHDYVLMSSCPVEPISNIRELLGIDTIAYVDLNEVEK